MIVFDKDILGDIYAGTWSALGSTFGMLNVPVAALSIYTELQWVTHTVGAFVIGAILKRIGTWCWKHYLKYKALKKDEDTNTTES